MDFITTISDRDTWFFRSSTWFNQIHVEGLSGTDGAIYLNGVNIYGQLSGNAILLSSLQCLTGNWEDTYTIMEQNSADWISVFTTVLGNSANWDSTYTTVLNNSAQWDESVSVDYLSGRIDSNTAHITSIGSVSAQWDAAYTNLVANSAAYLTAVDLSLIASTSGSWDSTYTTVNTNSATTWNYQGTDLKALSANWQNAFTNLTSNSAAYLTSVDISLIISTSANWDNAYTNLVTNSAAYLTSVDISLIASTSGNWDSTFTTVNNNSATTWNYQGTDLKSLSAGWASTQTTVNLNSAQWDETTDLNYLSGRIDANTNDITSIGAVSSQWDVAYTNLVSNSAAYLTAVDISLIVSTSANWDSAYTTVNANSASWEESTDISYLSGRIDSNTDDITSIGAVSSNWDNAYSNIITNSAAYLSSVDISLIISTSANWDSTYTTVNNNSSTNWNYQGTDLKSLSASWQNAYTNLTSNSATYLTAVDISLIISTSANWDSTYTTVQSNSATTWNYQGTDLKALSANWSSAYTNLTSNSAAYLTAVNISGLVPYTGATSSVNLSSYNLSANNANLNTITLNSSGTAESQGYDTLSNLALHYKMNDNAASTTVVDTIGSYNGTSVANTNTISVSGKINNALDFNGTTDYVSFTPTSLPVGNSSRSVSFWAKPDAGKIGDTYRVAFFYGTGNTGQMYGIGTNSGDGRWYITTEGPQVFGTVATVNWTHIVATYDGTTHRIYQNGVLTGSGSITTNTVLSNGYIGRQQNAGSYYFSGLLDDVRLYKRVLSQVDISALYNTGSGTEDSLLVPTVTDEKNISLLSNTFTFDSSGSFNGTLSASNLRGTNTGDQDLSFVVPYTGATSNVNLSSYSLSANNIDAVILTISPSTYALPNALGGTVTYDGDYTIHTFTSNDTFTINVPITADVLVVGGGGGGGGRNVGGGGGAGGYIYQTNINLQDNVNVVIGAGGLGGIAGSYHKGSNGGNTYFNTLTAWGGGGGSSGVPPDGTNASQLSGLAGGSGGGGGGCDNNTAGVPGSAIDISQGNAGGYGTTSIGGVRGGGGGGAGGAGINGSAGAHGGPGLQNNINGTSLYYAAGGGGGANGTGGTGGSSIGGNGGGPGGNTYATNGTQNTGSGGGGCQGYDNPTATGGSGGSGIVIVRYISTDIPNNKKTITVNNNTFNFGTSSIFDGTIRASNLSGTNTGDQDLSLIAAASGNWNSVYTTVNANSASWEESTDISYLSGRIDSNTAHITSIGSVSSNWDNVYTNLVTNSAAYLTSVDISLLISTSANWDSTYSTVNTNSATTWNYQGTDLKALSAGWSSTQTTVNTNSATWQLQTKSFIITNPTASAEYIIFRAPYNLTITRIDGFQTGGTGIDGMLTECDNNGLNPNKVNSTDMTLLTSNVSLTAFDNPSIDSGDYIGWMNGSISGDVSKFIVSVEYTRS